MSESKSAAVVPVVIDPALCTNCRKCLDSCPTGVFQIDAQSGKVEVRYPRDCHFCFLCVPDCADRAITVSWEAPNPRHRSVYDILGIEFPTFLPSQRKDGEG